jgi:hypothetical protein
MKRFNLQSSRLAQGLFAVAGIFVLLVISIFFVNTLKIIFFLLALPWLGYEWSLLKKNQPVWVGYDANNSWHWEDQSGSSCKLTILTSSVVTSWCVLLHVRVDDSVRRHIAIFSDQFIDKDHFRQLRVALRER